MRVRGGTGPEGPTTRPVARAGGEAPGLSPL
jgi:hypothetical protein